MDVPQRGADNRKFQKKNPVRFGLSMNLRTFFQSISLFSTDFQSTQCVYTCIWDVS